MSFLQSLLPRAETLPELVCYAADMVRTHAKGLPGCPRSYVPTKGAIRSIAVPDQSGFGSAVSVLMRSGLLVVDSLAQSGITWSILRTSIDGRALVCCEEGGGSELCWPRNKASGVTIGPGYDMGARPPDQVRNDLVAIGVPASVAQATGLNVNGLLGDAAGTYAKGHANDMVLSPAQQIRLFDKVAPAYEVLHAHVSPTRSGNIFRP